MNNTTSEITLDLNATGPHKVPLEYALEFRIAATCLHVVIFLIGFVGNIAVVVVVKRSRTMHTPTYCYLVSLAIADILVLISAMPEAIVSHHLYSNQWILGHFGCSVLIFGNFLGINASSTSILCFTIERYIGICHPLLAQKVCSVERAIKIILGTWFFAVVYCSPWLGLTITRTVHFDDGFPDQERCTFRLQREHYVYFFITDLVLFYVLPLMVSIVLYVRIGIVLHRSTTTDNLRKNISRQSSIRVTRNDTGNGQTPLLRSGSTNTRDRSGQDQKVQVVRMLLIVVISFALLWLPYRALLVYNSFAKPWLNIWYLLFAKTMIYINSAMNPVLYNAMSRRFRTEFMRVVFCVKPKVEFKAVPLTEMTSSRSFRISPNPSKNFNSVTSGSPRNRKALSSPVAELISGLTLAPHSSSSSPPAVSDKVGE